MAALESPKCKFELRWALSQQTPTFWAPGTSFVEDSFPTDPGGWGMVSG